MDNIRLERPLAPAPMKDLYLQRSLTVVNDRMRYFIKRPIILSYKHIDNRSVLDGPYVRINRSVTRVLWSKVV